MVAALKTEKMRDSILSFYTTARQARVFFYGVAILMAGCYIAVNRLLLSRSEQDVSHEVIGLLAALLAVSPVAYHFMAAASKPRRAALAEGAGGPHAATQHD
jgi:hypothetical protein